MHTITVNGVGYWWCSSTHSQPRHYTVQISFTAGRFTSGVTSPPVPTAYRVGRIPHLISTVWSEKNLLALTRKRATISRPRSS